MVLYTCPFLPRIHLYRYNPPHPMKEAHNAVQGNGYGYPWWYPRSHLIDWPYLSRSWLSEVRQHILQNDGYTTATGSKWNWHLLIVVALRILVLIPLDFHADYNLFPSKRKTYEITDTIAVSYQMVPGTLWTSGLTTLDFGMQDNYITFAFNSNTFVGIKAPRMI